MEGWQSRLQLPTAVDPRIPSDNPGGLFLSSVGIPITGLDVFYQSHLYNEELNLRHALNDTWTALIGFRAMQIYERFDMNVGVVPAPLLSIEAENRLYGFQIGGEGKLWTTERFELSTLLKAGLFENNSEQSTADLAGGISSSTPPYRLTASTNQASFIGEIGLNGRYRIGETILLRAGYNVMWVDDVTLASEQLNTNEFQTFAPPPDTALRGISAKDSLFIHGASVGFELTW
jgi:hypothetical protein